ADGKFLTGGSDAVGQKTAISVWETATGKALGPFEVLQNLNVSATLSPDGKVLATWGQHLFRGVDDRQKEMEITQTLQLWDVPGGKELRRISTGGYVGRVVFSPDGKTLATAAGPAIKLWEVDSGKELQRMAGRQGLGIALAFSPDGK